jgi:hypothetical protein
MGGSAQWWVHGPQARSRSETHDIYAENIKAAFGKVREEAWIMASALPVRWWKSPHVSTAGKALALIGIAFEN